MKGKLFPIKGGDVGATFQGTGLRARQVFTHPATSIADTLLTVIGNLLAWHIEVSVQLAMTLAHRDAATARNVIIHSAFWAETAIHVVFLTQAADLQM